MSTHMRPWFISIWLFFALLPGLAYCDPAASVRRHDELLTLQTDRGCKYVVLFPVADDGNDDAKKSEEGWRNSRLQSRYSWSGSCREGFIAGAGVLTSEASLVDPSVSVARTFIYAVPHKPSLYSVNVVKEPNGRLRPEGAYIKRLQVNSVDVEYLYQKVSDTECLADTECGRLRDALFSVLDKDQQDYVISEANRGASLPRSSKERADRDAGVDAMTQQRIRTIELEVKASERADKDKWLAERGEDGGGAPGALSAIGTMISAVGAAGGKNSAPLQAIGAAVQGAGGGGLNVAAPGMNSAGALQLASPASSSSEFPGVDLGKNVKFGKSAGNCVKVIRMPKESTYDVETPGLQNTCGVEISVVYCYEGGSFAGLSRGSTCAQQNLGSTKLAPNQKRKIMEVDSVKALYVQACEKPFVSVVPTWNGNTPRGACITSSKYGWGVGYMGGDMRD